jgi:hypothetical protein
MALGIEALGRIAKRNGQDLLQDRLAQGPG